MPDAPVDARSERRARTLSWVCLAVSLALVAAMTLPGLTWGLPSEVRNEITFGKDRDAWRAPDIPADERENPWEARPNFLQGGRDHAAEAGRSAFNPIRSYHPDEYVIFKSLSGMRPGELRLFHGFFGWPALQFYVVGFALKVCSWFRLVKLVPDMGFYFQNPDAMARMYVIGRLVTLVMALGCVAAVWRTAQRLFGQAGAVSAALLAAATPLFIVNAHYMTADVPMLFWISLALLASTHILQGGGRRWYLWAGVFLGLAAGTRYQGALAACVIFSAHLFREWRAEEEEGASRIIRLFGSRNLWLAAGISAVVFLLTNPYILLRTGQFRQELLGEFRGSGSPLLFVKNILLIAYCGLGPLLIAATLGAVWMALFRRRREIGFVVLGLGPPALLLAATNPAMARYMLPVIWLPTLATAWAFAEFTRRASEVRKSGAVAVPPLLLGTVWVVTLLQSLVFAGMYSKDNDMRTGAGLWIAERVPEGARIGVVSEPWQFELPPLSDRRHNIVVLEERPEALLADGPDYILTSDFQRPPVALRDPLDEGEQAFWTMAQGAGPYRMRSRWETWPPGFKDVLSHGPHDFRYTNPTIVLAERQRRGRRTRTR